LEQALTCFEQAICSSPRNVTALNNKAKVLSKLEREPEALATYKEILRLKPDHAKTWLNCALLMTRLGKLDNAMGCVLETIKLDGRNPDAWHHKGVVLWKDDKLDEALEAFGQALLLRTNFPEVYRDRGHLRRGQGRLQQAADQFAKALDLKSDDPATRLELGRVLLELGQARKAHAIFEALIVRDKDHVDAWDANGQALLAMDENARGLLCRGTGAMIRGDHEQALVWMDQAIELNSNYGEAWSNKGVVLGRLGRHEEALESYMQAHRISPRAVVVIHNIASILYHKLDRRQEGLRYYRETVRLEPKRWAKLPKDIRAIVNSP